MKKIIGFILIGFLAVNSPAEGRQVSAKEALKNINVLFLKGDYAALIGESKRCLADHHFRRPQEKEILYLTGLSYVKSGDFKSGRETFSRILAMKSGEFREDAYIGIADSYFYEKDFDKAIKEYEFVLDNFPRSERLANVHRNLALSHKEKKDFDRAATTETYYIVQVGIYKNLQNAKKIVKALRRKKYETYIEKIEDNGKTLYKVKVGKFSSERRAKKLARKLRKDRFIPEIIVE